MAGLQARGARGGLDRGEGGLARLLAVGAGADQGADPAGGEGRDLLGPDLAAEGEGLVRGTGGSPLMTGAAPCGPVPRGVSEAVDGDLEHRLARRRRSGSRPRAC